MGIHHAELDIPWDKPVDKSLWDKIGDYCENDVVATEAVFNARKADFVARQILADLSGMTLNDTTNSMSTRIIFGRDRKPQTQFNYRNLGDPDVGTDSVSLTKEGVIFENFGDEYTVFDKKGRPIFPGYKYEAGVSTYRGETVGEGGYVHSTIGIHGNVALLDVESNAS